MTEELDPSELGTQSYWRQTYVKELEECKNNGDIGEVWFGEDSARRVLDWIFDNDVPKDTAIIDLGCGNGYTLAELAREGYTDLLGVDYCQEAIDLAGEVTREFPGIQLQVFNITEDSPSNLKKQFGLVHDKGTYDAISLNPNNPKEERLKYIEAVSQMLKDNGLFIITSCNWTEEELLLHFKEKLKLKCVIPTPQFKFGGKTGSMVSSVVFIKNL